MEAADMEPVVFFDPFAAEHLKANAATKPVPAYKAQSESSPQGRPAPSRRAREVRRLVHDLALLAESRKAVAKSAD
jgi:hypothetical protein